MSNKIVEKQFYAFDIKLASPLNISSGYSDNTDADVLRNGNGEVFIPGTSIAGAIKEALGLEEKKAGIMGFTDGEEGQMSSLFISDLYFDKVPVVSERDGVSLNADKTVDNKFNMEIVETGAEGTIYISCIIRENDSKYEFDKAVKNIAQMLNSGAIRFGANKTRGFGRIELRKSVVDKNGENVTAEEYAVHYKVFSASNHSGYFEFAGDIKNTANYDHIAYAEWIKGTECAQNFIKIKVPLKLNGGISIRKYSTVPGEADYSHITCNGEPVIPGSSWNGAIRSDVVKILTELGCDKVKLLVDQWFGYVDINNKSKNDRGKENAEKALQSMVIIGESIIKDACRMPVMRNKIDRFDASVVDGAFYQDLSYFGGTTELEIMIKKDDNRDYLALIGVLELVIRDIQNGYVAVGGLTAIGRGIFECNGEIVYSEKLNDCDSALYAVV